MRPPSPIVQIRTIFDQTNALAENRQLATLAKKAPTLSVEAFEIEIYFP